ncbi:all-trans retinoic acid-induced differentiation factor [Coregonus clupeaformis]|uniref:all-trans retinoic acid-induced differentiation factor n=1 Tax=Coregonus clupeaformis TaxID=59861 RepID=UPI001BE0C323|nr:all-trans retinoic acid-induced differentiation factor [Coregonus clupeaformis]
MTAGSSQQNAAVVLLISHLCFYGGYQLTELQVGLCHRCNGTVQNGTAVSQFCSASAGLIDGRCCLQRKENTRDADYIIGLDLSNCSLSHVEDLQDAFNATTIDLSLNPIVNLNNALFEGFIQLANLILPANLVCPGGNASWDKMEVKGETRVCEGQEDICNQTGHLSLNCPENSLCAPYGPGFFQCSCVDDFYGYKCLREGEFPIIQVFGPLAGSTVLVSILLWVTQRRKARSI